MKSDSTASIPLTFNLPLIVISPNDDAPVTAKSLFILVFPIIFNLFNDVNFVTFKFSLIFILLEAETSVAFIFCKSVSPLTVNLPVIPASLATLISCKSVSPLTVNFPVIPAFLETLTSSRKPTSPLTVNLPVISASSATLIPCKSVSALTVRFFLIVRLSSNTSSPRIVILSAVIVPLTTKFCRLVGPATFKLPEASIFLLLIIKEEIVSISLILLELKGPKNFILS